MALRLHRPQPGIPDHGRNAEHSSTIAVGRGGNRHTVPTVLSKAIRMNRNSMARTKRFQRLLKPSRVTIRRLCIAGLLFALVVSSPAIAAQTTSQQQPTSADWIELIRSGRDLTEDQVRRLESELERNPSDLDARISLLGHYFFSQSGSAGAEADCTRHALWIVENEPAHPIAGMGYTRIDESLDPAGFARAKEIWKKHIAANPTNTKILGNAGRYLLHSDRGLAETYLLKARKLEPDNPEWPKRLGRLYMLSSRSEESCSKALRSYEAAFVRLHDAARYNALADAGKAAFCANELGKARHYAQELLDRAVEQQAGWNFGNAIHHGNLVLGRVALREGNIENAEQHLARAGKTSG